MPASRLAFSPSFIGIFCVFTGTLCFASKGILIKLAYQYGITATPLLMLRMLFALPFYAATALWLHTQELTPLKKGDGWKIAGLGLLSYYISSLLDFMGLEYISAGLERLILYVYPTLVLLMLAFWKKEKITRNTKLALAIAYSGMLLVFVQDLRLTSNWDLTLLGAGLVMLSTISFALFVVLAGDMISKVGPSRFTAYAMLAACAGVILHGISLGDSAELQQPKQVYLLALLLAFFCTVIPSFLMNKGISLIGSGRTAVLGSIGPVITLFLGALVLHEQITLVQLLGAGLVISGVGLATASTK
ncbi:MAG: DMT family transporter [Cellvibrio sp.]|uniref:DMT family transporter n=1 Tax=Cellvibrio sp. TaxID=1965322 RepID=UPI0027263C79|nr:DMT family transporter [Cellvibrio sp.]